MAAKKTTKRGLIISDMHCGHAVGLTPPAWQYKEGGWRTKFVKTQQACWNWFTDTLRTVGTPDVLIVNGDAIDGKGKRSGGTEQITTDMTTQADMACNIIKTVMGRNTKLLMTYGTPYHTGDEEDFESLVAHECNAKEIGGQVFANVNGVVLDLKHKVGSSSIPHGRATALKRTALWNVLWAEAGEQPKANVVVRSHVHYHSACYDPDMGWAITTPALAGFGSKYGSRQCEGRVHFGMIAFEVDPDGCFAWQPLIAKLKEHKSKAVRV